MKNRICVSALVAMACVATGTANAGIIGIKTGTAVIGDRTANLVTNGSFESRAPGDPPVTAPVYWSGQDGLHTESTLQALVYAIPGWSQTSGSGAYGSWGDASLLQTDPCADGRACVYFGNWATQPSPYPTFNGDGTVTFASPPTFTNADPDNQTPTTLFQTLSGLVMDATYLLDFWTSGEHYAAPFPDPGVFGLSLTSSKGTDSVFLTTPSVNSVFNANSIRYYVTFTADSSTETLSFTNWGHIFSTAPPTSTELIMDDVIVNRVPEPAALSLLAAGWVGLAIMRRGKNGQDAAA